MTAARIREQALLAASVQPLFLLNDRCGFQKRAERNPGRAESSYHFAHISITEPFRCRGLKPRSRRCRYTVGTSSESHPSSPFVNTPLPYSARTTIRILAACLAPNGRCDSCLLSIPPPQKKDTIFLYKINKISNKTLHVIEIIQINVYLA